MTEHMWQPALARLAGLVGGLRVCEAGGLKAATSRGLTCCEIFHAHPPYTLAPEG